MSRRFIVAVLLFALVAVALVAQPNVASRVLDRVFSDMEIDALVNDAVNELSDAEALLSSGAQLASTTSLNVRSGPCTDKSIVTTLSEGQVVSFTGTSTTACGHTWYGVRGSFGSGYASSKYLREVNSGGNSGIEAIRSRAADWAASKVGSCYSQAHRYGNPCYDCSSLVYLAYKQAGKDGLPLTTRNYPNPTVREISFSQIAKGDILWREGHVGMYIGNGQIVNAENEKNGVRIRDYQASKGRFTKVYRVV